MFSLGDNLVYAYSLVPAEVGFLVSPSHDQEYISLIIGARPYVTGLLPPTAEDFRRILYRTLATTFNIHLL